jgi:hypothetical protein
VVTGDVTYTALWKPDSYVATWAPGAHGTWNPDDETYTGLFSQPIPSFGANDPDLFSDPGWAFLNWVTLYSAPITIGGLTVHPITYLATWRAIDYVVYYDVDGDLTVVVDSANPYHVGDTVTVLSDEPVKTGYAFAGWDYDGDVYVAGDKMTMPAADATFIANFEVDPDQTYTIDYRAGAGGSVVPTSETNQVLVDASGSTATAADGYRFISWTDAAGDVVGNNVKYVPTVHVNAVFTANFEVLPVVKNIGFIGYYVFGDSVLSTSVYWQALSVGDLIDWVAVDAAYDDWVAKGGLVHGLVCVTSGPEAFTFAYGDAVGYDDFNDPEQLESYYLAFYVDPGYIIPAMETVVSVDPMAVFVGDWSGNTGRFDYAVEFGSVIPIDWDAVYGSYSFFDGKPRSDLQDVYLGLTDAKVAGWWTGGVSPQYFEGARPEITANEDILDTFFKNDAGLNIIALTPVFKVLPYEFDITVYHRVVETGDYLVYPGVGETYNDYDEEYIEWLNNVEGFTFLNLYLAAMRTNNPADMVSVEGYVCTSVEKNNLFDMSFELTQVGLDANVVALIAPKAAGHYEITFWYNKISDTGIVLCLCEKCVVCDGCVEDDCCDCDDCSPCICETVEVPNFKIEIFKPKTGSTNEVYINGKLVGEMKVETKTFAFEGYKIQITLNSRGTGNDNWITDFVWKLV